MRLDNLQLKMEENGLVLTDGNLSLMADFSSMIPRIRRGVLNTELLVRAARIKNIEEGRIPTAIDATAGLGEDSLLLAAAGFKVKLFERNKVIAELLKDALKRAAEIEELAEAVGRMEFVEGDSITGMKNLPEKPDVIYLDPMFPERKKSGLIKKKFQLLQQLELPCDNEEELLQAAISVRPHKIVIKRPAKGEYLAGIHPDYSIAGKAVRYDCLVFA